MDRKWLLFLCVSLSLASCYTTSPVYFEEEQPTKAVPPVPDPGKCNVRTVSPDIYIEYTKEYLTYTAEEAERYRHILVEVELIPGISRWEYSVYKGCKSDDPGKCQVLCWRSYPSVLDTVYIPVDGTMGNPLSKTLQVKELYEKGGLPIWSQIDCGLLDYNSLAVDFLPQTSTLSKESKAVIDGQLFPILEANPTIKIEISGHTSAVGAKTENQNLSKERAWSVVSYLMTKGVDSNRLVSVGYGESRLLNNCEDGIECTTEEHAVNQRIEFRVLN